MVFWLQTHLCCNTAVKHQVSYVILLPILLASKCRQTHLVYVDTQIFQILLMLRHSSPHLCYMMRK